LLILEQNDPQRRVETGGKLMARHFRSGERIADFILHGVSLAAGDLQQGAMLAREEDRQLRPVLVVILRALLIASAQGLGDAGIKLWDGVLKLAADLRERPRDEIRMCSTGIVRDVTETLLMEAWLMVGSSAACAAAAAVAATPMAPVASTFRREKSMFMNESHCRVARRSTRASA
jgi:hypothetical protein